MTKRGGEKKEEGRALTQGSFMLLDKDCKTTMEFGVIQRRRGGPPLYLTEKKNSVSCTMATDHSRSEKERAYCDLRTGKKVRGRRPSQSIGSTELDG